MTDETHLAQFIAGDHHAFAKIYAEHADNITGYLAQRYFRGDLALAEDAVQSAFLTLAQQATKLKLSEPLRPWLYLTAANAAIDIQRVRRCA